MKNKHLFLFLRHRHRAPWRTLRTTSPFRRRRKCRGPTWATCWIRSATPCSATATSSTLRPKILSTSLFRRTHVWACGWTPPTTTTSFGRLRSCRPPLLRCKALGSCARKRTPSTRIATRTRRKRCRGTRPFRGRIRATASTCRWLCASRFSPSTFGRKCRTSFSRIVRRARNVSVVERRRRRSHGCADVGRARAFVAQHHVCAEHRVGRRAGRIVAAVVDLPRRGYGTIRNLNSCLHKRTFYSFSGFGAT